MSESEFEGLLAKARGSGDAVASLSAAETLAAGNPDRLFTLGMAWIAARDPASAARQFDAAMSLLPPDPSLAFEVGRALEHADGLEQAIAAYRRAVGLAPDFVDAWVALATTLARAGDTAGATRAYEAALAVVPHHADALVGLASLRHAAAPIAPIIAPPLPRPKPAVEASPSPIIEELDFSSFSGGARHRAGPERRPAEFIPYTGVGKAPTVLMVTSAQGGNVRTEHTLTPDHFNLLRIQVEYWDPAATDDLPPYDVVWGAIGEADMNPGTLASAATIIERVTKPVLNRPEVVLGTGRRDIPGRLAGLEGVIMPATEMVTRAALISRDPAAALADLGFSFPLLIRPPGFHTGQHFHKVDRPADLAVPLRDGSFHEFLVTDFVDYRNADGQFRKYRVLFIDGELYPYHLAISKHWKIHYFSALMAGNAANKAEEERFLADMPAVFGPKGMAGLRGIQERMGLDYCGIDCSLSPEGDVIVFETNATMLIHSEESEEEFPYRHRHVPTLIEAFRRMFVRRAMSAGWSPEP